MTTVYILIFSGLDGVKWLDGVSDLCICKSL